MICKIETYPIFSATKFNLKFCKIMRQVLHARHCKDYVAFTHLALHTDRLLRWLALALLNKSTFWSKSGSECHLPLHC